MAEHRRYTFRPGTIGRFIKKYGITFNYLQVPPIMICRKQDHPGEKHFLLTLQTRAGGYLKIPLSQGAGIRGWPEIEQTLERLASDVLTYFDYPTPEDYGSAFGTDIEDWEQDFEVVKALTKATEKFLGGEAFRELIQRAHQGFEMEGDRGWRRQRTCGL